MRFTRHQLLTSKTWKRRFWSQRITIRKKMSPKRMKKMSKMKKKLQVENNHQKPKRPPKKKSHPRKSTAS